MWSKILVLFVRILEEVRESGFSVRTIKRLVSGKLDFVSTSKRSYSDWAMLVVQGLSTAIAMPAVFVLNILAIRHPEFKASLVQSATMISGLGNLLLNFYIFPRMALEETRGSADPIYYSAMLGKIGGIGIVAPIVIMFL
ncbi:MAG: hypothetical protein ABS76_02850 [Pelagibacterium sp. SCN 64-44]|nr:MAG: hypothetical protein ABS76_02850 [Pelagibacterium sp. SCN 64-44]